MQTQELTRDGTGCKHCTLKYGAMRNVVVVEYQDIEPNGVCSFANENWNNEFVEERQLLSSVAVSLRWMRCVICTHAKASRHSVLETM